MTGHASTVFSLVFSRNGKSLMSGGEDATIKIWDVATGDNLAAIQAHNGSVLALSVSPDDKTLASASADQTVKLWKIQTD
jgi:WD40 repeat protein